MTGAVPQVPPSATPDAQNAVTNQVVDQLNAINNKQNYVDANGNTIVTIGSGVSSGTSGVQINDTNGHKILTVGSTANGAIGAEFYDANQIPNALFGKYPDGSIALKIAKAGIDVTTAGNDQLIFNSNQDIFKIATSLTGTATFAIPSHTTAPATIFQNGDDDCGTLTLPHNLGFVPAIQIFALNSNSIYVPVANGSMNVDTTGGLGAAGFGLGLSSGTLSNVGMGFTYYAINVDSTNVTIKLRHTWIIYGASNTLSGTGSFNQTFKVYCLQETAN